MKVTITKKELNSYLDMVEEIMIPVVGEDVFESFKTELFDQVTKGVKEKFIKISVNKKLELVYEIDENFITKVIQIYTRYFAIIVPQVISIINASKALINDIDDIYYSEDEKPCCCKCRE